MMQHPEPDYHRAEELARLKFSEQERVRDHNGYPEATPRLSRRAYILIQFSVVLLISVGIVVAYHLLH